MNTASSLAGRAKLTDKRVLIVEDEPMVALLVEDELLGAGAEVVGPAFSVANALWLIEAAVADGGIDAAVLDINIGGEHVSPVAERLAALGVPFLFTTGYGEDGDTGGHVAAPMLRKPFDPAMLLSIVEGFPRAAV